MRAGNGKQDQRTAVGTTPRWVKAFAIAGGVLVLAFVILHLTGSMSSMHGSGPLPIDHAEMP